MELAMKKEYRRAILERYLAADRAEKGRILDEFCRTSGLNRKYAISSLNRAPGSQLGRPRRVRSPHYSAKTLRVVEEVWRRAGYPWSQRLKVILIEWLPWIRKHYRLEGGMEGQLLGISPRQLDRRLKPLRSRLKKRLYGRTKPGTLLKHHIPIRTVHWDVKGPGWVEIDLVAHCGNSADGEFIHSLNLTDIHTGWGETRAVMGKGEAGVVAALEEMERALPFELKGVDSDNGTEFINAHLFRYCERRRIAFTRGRPYAKQDNAHVEQKNWTHVRRVMGYSRYDTREALRAMNELYNGELSLMMNLYQPSVKLKAKTRVGSRLRRRYDRPRTPLERLKDSGKGLPERIKAMERLKAQGDPFVLSKAIDRRLEDIHRLANQTRFPSKPAWQKTRWRRGAAVRLDFKRRDDRGLGLGS